MSRLKSNRRGFTILELMIAMSVFAVVLLIVSQVIIRIGTIYQKGVTTTQVQDSARAAADQIAQDFKLNKISQPVPPPSAVVLSSGGDNEQTFCIDDVRYTYALGYRLGDSTMQETVGTTPYNYSPHILWRDIYTGPGCPPVDLNNPSNAGLIAGQNNQYYVPGQNGSELMTAGDRLTALCVGADTGGGCSWGAIGSSYIIKVVVAYADLDLLNGLTPSVYKSGVLCQGNIGDQFCATANITTAAVPRS